MAAKIGDKKLESVFVKHGAEITGYEFPGHIEHGRLLFAMAILSDCQEMVAPDSPVIDELNEAKELMSSRKNWASSREPMLKAKTRLMFSTS